MVLLGVQKIVVAGGTRAASSSLNRGHAPQMEEKPLWIKAKLEGEWF